MECGHKEPSYRVGNFGEHDDIRLKVHLLLSCRIKGWNFFKKSIFYKFITL